MANEQSLSFSLNLSKSGAVLTRAYNKSVDVTGRPTSSDVVAVTPAGMDLDLGQVATIGHVSVKHLSEGTGAALVYVGESGNFSHKAKPGEWVEGRWNFTTVNVKTDAGIAWVEYAIISE